MSSPEPIGVVEVRHKDVNGFEVERFFADVVEEDGLIKIKCGDKKLPPGHSFEIHIPATEREDVGPE